LWRLLRLLLEAVQEDHFAALDAEDDAPDAPAGQAAAHFPQPVPERAAIGHADRPAEFHLLNVVANDASILFRQFEKPFADRPPPARLRVEPACDLLCADRHGRRLCQKWHVISSAI